MLEKMKIKYLFTMLVATILMLGLSFETAEAKAKGKKHGKQAAMKYMKSGNKKRSVASVTKSKKDKKKKTKAKSKKNKKKKYTFQG